MNDLRVQSIEESLLVKMMRSPLTIQWNMVAFTLVSILRMK